MALTKVRRGGTDTGISDSSNATAISIDSSERVGIGTASPNSALETVGLDGITISNSGDTFLQCKTTGTTASNYIEFKDSGGASGNIQYNHTGNYLAFKTNGSENLRVANGFISYGAGVNSYSDSIDQHAGSETLTPSNSSNGATETVTASVSLPYQRLIPCAIMVYVNGNSAITWHFSTLVYNTFHASGTQVTSTVNGQGASYFDATPTFSTSGSYNARKVTATLNLASNSAPTSWRVLIRYGIGGPT